MEMNRPYPDTNVDIIGVKPIKETCLLVEFANDKTREYDVKRLFAEYPQFKVLKDEKLFNAVQHGNYSVFWNDELDISEIELWYNGIDNEQLSNVNEGG
ncbi:MAG: DUF2442 domain-containing protein [Oscillospiraceae bacterium]|nr:DUF2442 domain-containing protein [Oscillospiraceae bacterium]